MTTAERHADALRRAYARDQETIATLRVFAGRHTQDGTIARAMLLHVIALAHSSTRPTVRSLAKAQGIIGSTLLSRAFRAGVDLKPLMDRVRLVRVAAMLSDATMPVSVAAEVIRHSSPQALTRHIQTTQGMPLAVWRQTQTEGSQLALLESELAAASDGLAVIDALAAKVFA